MSNEQTKTTAALDAASTKTTSTTANGAITFSDEPNAVTIVIQGEGYEHLKEIAQIFGAWNETSTTPADIIKEYLMDFDEFSHLHEKIPSNSDYCTTLAGQFCSKYRDCEGSAQLEAAFVKAGFSTQC